MKKAAERLILCAGVLLAVAIVSEAQQAKKIYRIDYITISALGMGPKTKKHFDEGCASSDILRGKTLSSNGDLPERSWTGTTKQLRLSLFVSRLIVLSPQD